LTSSRRPRRERGEKAAEPPPPRRAVSLCLSAAAAHRAPAPRVCHSRVCSSQTGIIRKYHIFMCRQCFRDQAHLIGFRKVRLRSLSQPMRQAATVARAAGTQGAEQRQPSGAFGGRAGRRRRVFQSAGRQRWERSAVLQLEMGRFVWRPGQRRLTLRVFFCCAVPVNVACDDLAGSGCGRCSLGRRSRSCLLAAMIRSDRELRLRIVA
jgi:ribosomal protein S14